MTEPIRPAFGTGCLTEILPAMLGYPPAGGSALPIDLSGPEPKVLLVLDGLGWEQLQARLHVAPTIASFAGGPITSVAPSTTAAALTSITTGLTPGEHGVVGYRMMVGDEVLNTLRWHTDRHGDARKTIPPDVIQPYSPFMGERVALVSKAEFARSGFSKAHLRGVHLTGYRTAALLVHETARLVSEGEPVVYAYYDGIDKIAHEYGLGSEYEAELGFVDYLVASLLDALPEGTQLALTADHGQVDCRDGTVLVSEEVQDLTASMSGEGRFRWLHAHSQDTIDSLLSAAEAAHGHHAWVASREQILDEHWFGQVARPEVQDRLGDVALLPFEPISFFDPKDSGLFELIGRHGSLTSAEMYVPLVSAIVGETTRPKVEKS